MWYGPTTPRTRGALAKVHARCRAESAKMGSRLEGSSRRRVDYEQVVADPRLRRHPSRDRLPFSFLHRASLGGARLALRVIGSPLRTGREMLPAKIIPETYVRAEGEAPATGPVESSVL